MLLNSWLDFNIIALCFYDSNVNLLIRVRGCSIECATHVVVLLEFVMYIFFSLSKTSVFSQSLVLSCVVKHIILASPIQSLIIMLCQSMVALCFTWLDLTCCSDSWSVTCKCILGGFRIPSERYRSVRQLGLDISISSPYPLFHWFYQCGWCPCLPFATWDSWLGCPDLPAMDSGLHQVAGCHWWKLLAPKPPLCDSVVNTLL